MEKGLIYALLAAVCFAGSIVFVRKVAVRTGESFSTTIMSVIIGVPFFAIAISFTGEWPELWSASGHAFILLAAAGVIHFIVGRFLSYNGYRLLGANRGSTLSVTAPFYTVIFGVLFLKELLTAHLVLGVLLIFTGAVLITLEKSATVVTGQSGRFSARVAGVLSGLGGALCWGSTPILIKPALAEIGSPYVGAFVSYVAAFIAMLFIFFRKQLREQMVHLPLAAVLSPLFISAIFASVGQLFLYLALKYSPASMVTPLVNTHVLLVFLLSLFLSRDIEIFSLKVILAMLVTVGGTFLIFQ